MINQSCSGFSINLTGYGTFYVNLALKKQKKIVPFIVTEEHGRVNQYLVS